MENRVEAVRRVVDVLVNVVETVETGTRVTIVVVAFWANAELTSVLNARMMVPASIVVVGRAKKQEVVEMILPVSTSGKQRGVLIVQNKQKIVEIIQRFPANTRLFRPPDS